ncbi:MAG: nucleotide-binding protein [Nitrospinae bacterium]|nr:nucleotide-binding protein [Nitrospinota bacterium]
MKVKILLEKMKEFKDLLQEHYELWGNSLNDTIPDYPIKNHQKLKEQQTELFKLFYQIDEYLTKYSKGRIMYHPATGVKWDIYKSAIGNDIPQIKVDSIRNALLELEGIIAILEGEDAEKEITTDYISSQKERRIFISHGIETNALIKLERFLRGLGIAPVIVKNEPSEGKAIDDLVEDQMDTCMAVIILATKDDKVKTAKEEYYQPRPNVIHEMGLAQEKIQNNIIYLKEEGCIFPSNIAPKVWENFTHDNMDEAFIKIAKELKAFRII